MSAAVLVKSLPQITVPTAGTPVRFTSTHIDKVVAVYVSCPNSNTTNMLVGDSTVKGSSPVAGVEIVKNTTPTCFTYNGHYIDLREMYVDAITSGEKLSVTYLVVA